MQEIKNGDFLSEETLPIPTRKNKDKIYFSEKSTRFHAYRGWKSAYLGEGNIVTIDKPTYSEKDDRNVPLEKYDFEQCVVPRFDIRFCQGSITDYPVYKQLTDINAYLFLENGLLFVKNEKLFFLFEGDRRFYFVGYIKKNILKMENNKNVIEFQSLGEYKMLSQNQWYAKSGEDYTGYEDKYEIQIKKIILKKEKLMELIRIAKDKLVIQKWSRDNITFVVSFANLEEQWMNKNTKLENKKMNFFNETYGEVQGTEKWKYFFYKDVHESNVLLDREVARTSIYRKNREQVYYNNRFYYYSRGYIWESNTDGTEKRILMKWEYENIDSLFVNKYGIFIVYKKNIKVIDFLGNEVDRISTIETIKDYYICNDKIFLITTNETERDCAKYYDLSTKRFHNIYKGYYIKTFQSSQESVKVANINHIMANEKHVVMKLEFWEYYYPEDENEKTYEMNTGGWYSYDYNTSQWTSLDAKECYPHFLVEKGPAEYTKMVEKKCYEIYTGHPLVEGRDYFNIVCFNMEKDLMWTAKKNNGGEIWEPRRIGNVYNSPVIKTVPVWIVKDAYEKAASVYFDGNIRINKFEDSRIYAYDSMGNRSENWLRDGLRDDEGIKICGNYIFIKSDAIAYDCKHQFLLELKLGEALRPSWMVPNGKDDTAEIRTIINEYEESKCNDTMDTIKHSENTIN